MDIIEVLQEKVNEIAEKSYNCECKPVFTVSLLQEESDTVTKKTIHKIVLTIVHNRFSQSAIIFPVTKYSYGYAPLEEEMKWLYNSTM